VRRNISKWYAASSGFCETDERLVLKGGRRRRSGFCDKTTSGTTGPVRERPALRPSSSKQVTRCSDWHCNVYCSVDEPLTRRRDVIVFAAIYHNLPCVCLSLRRTDDGCFCFDQIFATDRLQYVNKCKRNCSLYTS